MGKVVEGVQISDGSQTLMRFSKFVTVVSAKAAEQPKLLVFITSRSPWWDDA